jgi:hypothetical protein
MASFQLEGYVWLAIDPTRQLARQHTGRYYHKLLGILCTCQGHAPPTTPRANEGHLIAISIKNLIVTLGVSLLH